MADGERGEEERRIELELYVSSAGSFSGSYPFRDQYY
jgi:hypothetical protein